MPACERNTPAKARPWLVFHHIHSGNYAVARLLSSRYNIGYWRHPDIPAGRLKWAASINPAGMIDRTRWNSVMGEAHRQLAFNLRPHWERLRVTLELSDIHADLTSQRLQLFAREFESWFLFDRLLAIWRKHRRIDSRITVVLPDTRLAATRDGIDLPPPEAVRLWPSLSALDRFRRRTSGAQRLCRRLLLIASTLVRPRSSSLPKNIKVFWHQVSPAGLAVHEGKIDFSFLARRGLARAEDMLFMLPSAPAGSVARELEARAVQYVLAKDLLGREGIGKLPWNKRLRYARQLIECAVPGRVRGPKWLRQGIILDMIEGLGMLALLRHMDCRLLLISLGAGLVEPPVTSLAKAAGIRAAAWNHSFVGTAFVTAEKHPGYRNLITDLSIIVSDECWGWFQACADMLKERNLQPPGRQPRFRATGPLMSGDGGWLSLSPQEARARHGIDGGSDIFWVGFFDLPAHHHDVYAPLAAASSQTPVEVQERICETLLEALARFPRLGLIIKPKRGLDNDMFLTSATYRRLTDPGHEAARAGRVHLLEPDIDPYIPIALCDAAVGMPYTSPVLAAVGSGRPGMYMGVTEQYQHTFPKAIADLTARGQAEVLRTLGRWCDGKDTTPESAREMTRITEDPQGRLARFMDDLQA